MSAPGAYRRERIVSPSPFTGPECRAAHPVARLSRALDDLCCSASGPLEIAVVLETLGYSRPTLEAEYEVTDVFDLARALYAVSVPARWRRWAPRVERP